MSPVIRESEGNRRHHGEIDEGRRDGDTPPPSPPSDPSDHKRLDRPHGEHVPDRAAAARRVIEQHVRPQGEQASVEGPQGKGDEGRSHEVRGYEPGDGKEHGGDDGRRLHQKAGRNDESPIRRAAHPTGSHLGAPPVLRVQNRQFKDLQYFSCLQELKDLQDS